MINPRTVIDALVAAGLPVTYVGAVERATDGDATTFYQRPDGTVRIVWSASPTAEQDAAAADIIATHDAGAEIHTAAESVRGRAVAAARLSRTDAPEKLLRAVVLTMMDEMNAHALKINSILDAIDGASTLAQVKAAIASIADYPQRTAQQVRTAIVGKLTAGDADS